MSIFYKLTFLISSIFFISGTDVQEPEWGFFGHKKINRMAVFTLPQEMLGFYKKHIEYVTEHSIDPDKRRYNTDYEAIRHYIDLDNFGTLPFDDLPREFSVAIAYNTEIYLVNEDADSTLLIKTSNFDYNSDNPIKNKKCRIDLEEYLLWNETLIENFGQREEYEIDFEVSALPTWLSLTRNPKSGRVVVIDKFSEYGIAPFYLEKIYSNLINAFRDGNGKKILQLSSDIGHYISDIHVPLHTTKNYNGADTDQLGIHAFWETRLPELYADQTYDFFVGKAEYISDESDYIWDTVFRSHELLAEVFAIEKELSQTYPRDQQYCYEERNSRTIRLECEEYAQAYHDRMNGMVEQRMRESIKSVGSIWFSAWILAGQPNLSSLTEDINFGEEERKAAYDIKVQSGEIKGRKHTN